MCLNTFFFSGIFDVIPICRQQRHSFVNNIYFKFWLFFDNHLLLYIHESTRRDVPTITNTLHIYYTIYLYTYTHALSSFTIEVYVCGHKYIIILFYAYNIYCIPEMLEVNCYFCDLKRFHNNHICRRNQVIWKFKFKSSLSQFTYSLYNYLNNIVFFESQNHNRSLKLDNGIILI